MKWCTRCGKSKEAGHRLAGPKGCEVLGWTKDYVVAQGDQCSDCGLTIGHGTFCEKFGEIHIGSRHLTMVERRAELGAEACKAAPQLFYFKDSDEWYILTAKPKPAECWCFVAPVPDCPTHGGSR